MPVIDTTVLEKLQLLLETDAPAAEIAAVVDELQPYDLATIIKELEEPAQLALLKTLAVDVAAETLIHLDPLHQYQLLDHLPENVGRSILNAMSSSAMVDLFIAIHPRQAKQLLGWLPLEYETKIRGLMTYPENTAGGIATIDYVAAREGWTVEQTLTHVRKVGPQADLISYIYILDNVGRLVGVLSLRELIMAPPQQLLSEFANRKLITVSAEADQEEAAQLLAQYDLKALPVLSEGGRMVGIITIDEVLDVIQEEATEDIQRLGGSQPLDAPYLGTNFFALFRKRVGWLLALIIAQAFTGNILRFYEGLLQEVVALAFFIPLLLDTGGNAGAQAATLVIRAMAMGEITPGDFLRIVWREARLGIVLGLAMALITLLWVFILEGSLLIGLTVATTVITLVTLSSSVGAAMPLIGKRFGVDPAVFSAPVITTIVDASGLLIYFQIARFILQLGF